jgi:hypothetical protein
MSERKINMAGDSMSVARQPLHPPVQYPPAGNPVAAPARGVPPGSAGNHPKPDRAAAGPKLRVPGPATDPKAAEKQAEKDTYALADAYTNFVNATPERISKAEAALETAQEKAERTTVHNATVQYENRARKLAIVKLADTELTQLQADPYPGSLTLAQLDAAHDRLNRATNDFAESNDSFARAEQMLYEVAGVPMLPGGLSTDAATKKYPNLVMAQGKFNRARNRLLLGGERNIEQNYAKLETAAKELDKAWEMACKHAGSGTKLSYSCHEGLAIAKFEVERVNKMKPR